jgi:predicted GNAT family acetyltransferase
MRLESHGDAEAFLARAGELLGADEARHNLPLGICSTLIESPTAYPHAFFWTVENGGPLAAFLMTPPFNIVVAKPRDPNALAFAATELHAAGVVPPGAGGARPEVDEFVSAWEQVAGVTRRLRMAHGVYAAHEARVPSGVQGEMREAQPSDQQLVLQWLRAFQDEALPGESARDDLDRVVERRLASASGGLALWEVDSRPVSLCGYAGLTPHGIRIGPVYTPPELRRRGYASALVGRLTQDLLAREADFCFLYTDLDNPTSNRIYQDVGYELVAESVDYAFDRT